jgi:hypothetical protein
MRFVNVIALIGLLISTVQGETNVVFYLGGAHTQNSSLTLHSSAADQLTFANVPFQGRSFESPLYYGGRIGHFFSRHFGIEAEFIHLKMYADAAAPVHVTGRFRGALVNTTAPMSNYAQRFSISHGNNLLLFNGAYRQGFFPEPGSKGLGRLLLTVRAGVGPTIPHAEVTFAGNSYESYFLGRVAIQAAAGVEWKLWRGLYAFSEYKFTHNPQRVDLRTRFFKVDANSHHGVFGVSAHF